MFVCETWWNVNPTQGAVESHRTASITHVEWSLCSVASKHWHRCRQSQKPVATHYSFVQIAHSETAHHAVSKFVSEVLYIRAGGFGSLDNLRCPITRSHKPICVKRTE